MVIIESELCHKPLGRQALTRAGVMELQRRFVTNDVALIIDDFRSLSVHMPMPIVTNSALQPVVTYTPPFNQRVVVDALIFAKRI